MYKRQLFDQQRSIGRFNGNIIQNDKIKHLQKIINDFKLEVKIAIPNSELVDGTFEELDRNGQGSRNKDSDGTRTSVTEVPSSPEHKRARARNVNSSKKFGTKCRNALCKVDHPDAGSVGGDALNSGADDPALCRGAKPSLPPGLNRPDGAASRAHAYLSSIKGAGGHRRPKLAKPSKEVVKAATALASDQRSDGPPTGSSGSSRRYKSESVSYTHLTLPTNREV